MIAPMRTTVTLDPDVERLLRAAFVLAARPLGLRAGIDPTSFNKLAESLLREESTVGLGTRIARRFSEVGGVDLPEVARSLPRIAGLPLVNPLEA